MLISSWINKLWHVHRMECHSVTNLNEALRDTTTQLSQKPVTKDCVCCESIYVQCREQTNGQKAVQQLPRALKNGKAEYKG